MTAETPSAAADMGAYVAKCFFAYEAVRDARDEALTRCQELEDERDQARRIAASLEAEVAKVREMHSPAGPRKLYCYSCMIGARRVVWPCSTARVVYLTDGDVS